MKKTIRDEFAIAAMQALIPASSTEPGKVAGCESIANLAYIFADAMMVQREVETIDTRTKEEE